MTPKSSVIVMQSCVEAYERCCKPIRGSWGMPAFDILMFLSDSPEHCAALREGLPEEELEICGHCLAVTGQNAKKSQETSSKLLDNERKGGTIKP